MEYVLFGENKEFLECKSSTNKDNFIYDKNSGNYHLVPNDLEIAKQISNEILEKMINLKTELIRQLRNKNISYKEKKIFRRPRTSTFQKNGYEVAKDIFSCLSVQLSNNPGRSYDLMCFRVCKNENTIECQLKAIQFATFTHKLACDIYPTTLENEARTENEEKSDCQYYYNPSVNFKSSNQEIIKIFIDFIEKNKKENSLQKSKLYIAKKNIVGVNTNYFLKLNRQDENLEVYKRIDENCILHKYYSIRDDFDSSDYVMFEREKYIPCIFGGENSPTPEGMFKVEKVSETREEYVSEYYSKYKQVKFFGYLIIFEDYFIHSDMYKFEIEKEAMEYAESISKNDKHTAGCIRVEQSDLDWLIENIKVGTTIIM